jgi:two-component system, NtrC family, sensor kinase
VQRQEQLPRTSKKALARLLSSFKPDRTQEVVECCLRELVRYYRHSGVGRNCRGIVHQMNTPLQVLSFQLELLEQKSQEEPSLAAAADQAASGPEASGRHPQDRLRQCRQELENLRRLACTLVREGLHEEAEGPIYLDLNQLCQQELELFQANPFFKHEVKKDFSFGESLPPLYGHYIDFSQSFRNLIDNALEAMAGDEVRRLAVLTSLKDNHLVLEIGDSGSGVPPENLSRIFEPFFTTKGKDRAGLGLFLARRLLAPYGGKIQVTSRPGETWFSVRLPVS